MQNGKLNKLRTVLAVLLLAFSIFSVAYIGLERCHHCSGSDCAVCFVINLAEQNFKLLSVSVAFAVAVRHYFAFRKTALTSVKKSLIKSNSLISQKIRLND